MVASAGYIGSPKMFGSYLFEPYGGLASMGAFDCIPVSMDSYDSLRYYAANGNCCETSRLTFALGSGVAAEFGSFNGVLLGPKDERFYGLSIGV